MGRKLSPKVTDEGICTTAAKKPAKGASLLHPAGELVRLPPSPSKGEGKEDGFRCVYKFACPQAQGELLLYGRQAATAGQPGGHMRVLRAAGSMKAGCSKNEKPPALSMDVYFTNLLQLYEEKYTIIC